MTAYATVSELADALEVRVTAENTALLQACLDAAAAEIDHELPEWSASLPGPSALVNRTNVDRAVEWFKAPAAYNGGVGFSDIGTIEAPSGFERHAAALLPLKQSWGLA